MTASFVRRLAAAALALGASLSLSACGINSVPTAEENAKAKWGDVQSAYQRRADLIPNLVATAVAAAGSENQILTNVTKARASATAINITTNDLSDPETFQKFQNAQNQLTQAMGQFRSVVESNPQLKSQDDFTLVMHEYAGTENRINEARRDYNAAVQAYNTTIRTFPDAIGAKVIYGAKPMQSFTADPGAATAPKVDFGGTTPGAAPANDNAASPAAKPAAAAAQ